jgi:hypothetical protein
VAAGRDRGSRRAACGECRGSPSGPAPGQGTNWSANCITRTRRWPKRPPCLCCQKNSQRSSTTTRTNEPPGRPPDSGTCHRASRTALAEGVHVMPARPVLHGDNGATPLCQTSCRPDRISIQGALDGEHGSILRRRSSIVQLRLSDGEQNGAS